MAIRNDCDLPNSGLYLYVAAEIYLKREIVIDIYDALQRHILVSQLV